MHRDSTLQQAHREYMESRILAAQPIEIIEMLYQVAIRSLKIALAELTNGNASIRAREVTRAQDAINELMFALDHSAGASFSRSLASLYAYAQQEILKGHAQKSAEGFRNALSVLTTLEEGWIGVREQLAGKSPSEPPAYEVEAANVVAAPPSRLAEYQPAPIYQESRDWSC
jgi:flagellar biosynthetic protein FliS